MVWVPSRTTVTRINPKKMDYTFKPLKTNFTSVNEQKIKFAELGKTKELPKGENSIKVEFEAIGFYRPLAASYSYRLLEKEEKWSDWQAENSASFTNLASGDYNIQVRTKTVGTSASESEFANLPFAVNLFFWQEPNFFLFAFLIIGILASLSLYYYFRQKTLRIRALQNEEEVKYLRVQTLQAQMNPHFIFNVLGTLQNLILNSDVRKANEHLVNLSILIRRFLDSSVKSDLPKRFSAEYEISLEKEIELLRMYIEFEALQYEDEFEYEMKIDPELNESNYTLPPMIIQPFVENAIKHGLLPKKGLGKLFVHIYEENENLVCIIEDDGIGRSRSKEKKAKSLRAYKSHGTNLVRKRITILNGMGYNIRIKTMDRTGGGTFAKIQIGFS